MSELLLFAGAWVSAWFLRGVLARRRPGWRVECAGCLTHRAIGGATTVASDDDGTVPAPRTAGPRRQLYLELWDSYGNLYEKWAVGRGEQLATRDVGPWLLDQVAGLVRRLNAYQGQG